MTEVVGITGVCLALAHDSDNTHHCQGHYTALKKNKTFPRYSYPGKKLI
jgi:hypothetical protein